jgi:predicted small secreted protein
MLREAAMHVKAYNLLKYVYLAIFFLAIFALDSFADVMVEINNIKPDKIEMAGFKLSGDQTVSIELYGLQPYRNRYRIPYTCGWILNADTRELVWETEDGDIDREGRREYSCKDKVDLKKGTYEVYYAAFPYSRDWQWDHHNGFSNFLGHFFGAIFDGRDEYYDYDFEKLFIRVEGKGKGLSEEDVLENQEVLKNKALISFSPLGRERVKQSIVTVNEPTEINIYAIGEARRDGDFDFGWITNMQTRERVWELTYRKSKHAGGANKNRQSHETITLQPGTYKISYITDDTHHYRHWNLYPPYDPEFWGLTIWLENPKTASHITMKEVEDLEETGHVIVDFTHIRDNEYRAEGFTLNRDLDIHVLAIGEGRDDEMFDYGWIVDTKTREKVWKMNYRDTEPAGGASKNRMFDGIIHLKAGNYMAYYMTDDSHAYHSWNASAPFAEKKYGMTISVIDDNYKEGDITAYEEEEDKSIIAKIVRVGDYAREKKEFILKKDGPVHIYAIGEGRHGEMFDYAYIQDANTGKVVWEMTYRQTDRAGGAHKNRLYDDDFYLKAGTYYVVYETDDSHSFEEWNSSPPDDPFNYGVTITYSK